MKSFFKVFGWVVGIFIGLFIAGIILLVTLFNPNHYRQEIDQAFYENTGRHLVIKDIKFEYFPWLGIQVHDAVIGSPTQFNNVPLAKVGDLVAKIRLMPLFTGNLKIGDIVLSNATFNLITDGSGKSNWQSLSSGMATPADQHKVAAISPATQKTKPSPKAKKNVTDLSHFSIKGIEIHNASLNLINQKNHETTRITHFNLVTSDVRVNHAFPIKISFDLANEATKTLISTEINSRIFINLRDQLYKLTELKIQNRVNRPKLPTLRIVTTGDAALNLSQPIFKLTNFSTKLASLVAKGNLQITHLTSTPVLTATLKAPAFALGPLVKALKGIDQISGTASFSTRIKTTGSNSKAMLSNLSGVGQLAVKAGTLKDVSLKSTTAHAIALLNQQQPARAEHKGNNTQFSNLTATFHINQGIVSNNDLKATVQHSTVTGKGTINLPLQTLNYQVTASFPYTMEGQAKTLQLPIILSGPLAHPKVTPNYQALVKQTITQIIENKLKDITKGLNLKGLFGK